MSHRVSIYLTSMCLLLNLSVMHAQEQANMVLCENTRVSLGQSKQQVRNALAVCCRLSNNRIDQKEGTIEFPNQIVFEANRTGICSGSVVFDTSEKLVYAQRDFGQFNEGDSVLGLAHAVTEAISGILPRPASKPGAQGGTLTFADAKIELHAAAGPLGSQNTLFITVAGRTLRFTVNDATQIKLVVVEEEIGDLSKGDLKSVPVPK